jgi:carbon monoxide dehydrogenase subunit G
MEFAGRYFIPASQTVVWSALNDPNILRMTIPGCERMEKIDATHFHGTAKWKIGPVKIAATARINLQDVEPPRRLTLKVAGEGGVAGFAKGEADVALIPENGGTQIVYAVRANIGGKLMKLGQRLIHGTAQQVADGFFSRFAAAIRSIPIENGDEIGGVA